MFRTSNFFKKFVFLFRNALEEFNKKHYPNVNFAFDGRRNMYTIKEIKGVCS